MEALANMSKRKRRKTRKSLNEIKKRCDHATLTRVSDFPSDPKYVSKFNNHISSNRLTLFNNVIQSKTVLRGQGFNSVNNICLKNASNKIKFHNTKQTLRGPKICKKKITPHNKLDINITMKDIYAQESDILKSTKDKIFLSSTSSEETSPLMQTALHVHSQESFDLYESFVKNIPTYLKELVPQLIEGDPMKTNKQTLHQIWKDLHTIKKRNEVCEMNCCSSPLRKQPSINCVSPNLNSSSQSSWQIDLETAPNSSQSNLSEPSNPHSGSTNSAISSNYYLSVNQYLENDSPEYIYYPHRLNQ